MEPRKLNLLGMNARGFHNFAYVEWGAPSNPHKVMCVHGLTRQSRDFDALASSLASSCHVACPDIVGRGNSDWLSDKSGYGFTQYCADMTVLIGRLNAEAVDWVGTSMGGFIGMFMAANVNSPIRRLVLNDIGPFVPKQGIERLATYVGREPLFADVNEAVAYTREVAAPFGKLSDADWLHLTVHCIRREEGGGWRLHYDPAIAAPLRGDIQDMDLWQVWDQIRCPVLVLRGADSDLLRPETVDEMTRRGPKATVVEIPGCGHAPALMAPEQIKFVRNFLTAHS
jgi:pimeloyl-ACP methyl ester carboxylesterase